jgi:hypothetical protein
MLVIPSNATTVISFFMHLTFFYPCAASLALRALEAHKVLLTLEGIGLYRLSITAQWMNCAGAFIVCAAGGPKCSDYDNFGR